MSIPTSTSPTTVAITADHLIRLATADKTSLSAEELATRKAILLDVCDAEEHPVYPFMRTLPAGHEIHPWAMDSKEPVRVLNEDVYLVDQGCGPEFQTADIAEAINTHIERQDELLLDWVQTANRAIYGEPKPAPPGFKF